jgi:CheY-like chemotaxis protein
MRCTPDVVLLDLQMPVMNGWEFRNEQREMDRRLAAIPILLVSAEETAARQAALMNVAGMLQKPIEPDDLVEAVGTVLGG